MLSLFYFRLRMGILKSSITFFGMDEENISDLKNQAPRGSTAKILLLGDFDPEGDRIIRDPYYDRGSEGFEKCYQQCIRSCNGFLDSLNK
ncbi:hypothetical protein NQ318_019496 [Aromia moschata]|uniref:protein-tyrosine-phosphatase n=1 Tax=Aromia moschata TaxID=1265417 RepID=A0AAV8XXI4_9CUCU|nr:hypothetical protein NQ318_019496 [Aromia moschata]